MSAPSRTAASGHVNIPGGIASGRHWLMPWRDEMVRDLAIPTDRTSFGTRSSKSEGTLRGRVPSSRAAVKARNIR
jgi:hypothetical protein